jgi:hypothetical protein
MKTIIQESDACGLRTRLHLTWAAEIALLLLLKDLVLVILSIASTSFEPESESDRWLFQIMNIITSLWTKLNALVVC